ncbi:hypothetical protein D3C86_1719210 [compost metagenome]
MQPSLGQLNRQHPVTLAIVIENPGEAGADQCPDPHLLQAPDRVLATRTAAKVGPDHQERGVAPGRLIEDEFRVGRAGFKEPQIEEQAPVQPLAVDPLEKLLGHDDVGVDVGRQERRCTAGDRSERLHASSLQGE